MNQGLLLLVHISILITNYTALFYQVRVYIFLNYTFDDFSLNQSLIC